MTNSPSVLVFAMPERGHFNRLRPLIAGLVSGGATTHVFTHARFRAAVERAGGRFTDLFAGRPIEGVDATSIPMSARFVSWAGRHGDAVTREAAEVRPSLVIHDTFAVIGRVVAHHLCLPRVNVCAGHNLRLQPTVEALRRDVRVRLADACWRGARLLADRHGMPDASPFCYISGGNAELNIYCEPPEFLRPDERAPFEPIAFFGSLWPEDPDALAGSTALFGEGPGPPLRLYASFGTVIWRYFEAEALNVLRSVAEAFAARRDGAVVVSLGGVDCPRAGLAGPNVRVETYVDQGQVLRGATICLTHHGLNSTHEAILHGVPMVSYPFFWDQPALAARCQELGLAHPLTSRLRGEVGPADVEEAVGRVAETPGEMHARLADARRWELETIRRRPEVIARVLSLIR